MPLTHAIFRGALPFVQTWWRLRRGVTLGVRIAAFDQDGRVAVVRHTYQPGWRLPGGGVERGEHAEEAARRELEEEAHAVPESPLELIGVYTNFAEFPGDHVLFYRTTARSLGDRTNDLEIADVAWLPVDGPLDDAHPSLTRRLAELAAGAERALEW